MRDDYVSEKDLKSRVEWGLVPKSLRWRWIANIWTLRHGNHLLIPQLDVAVTLENRLESSRFLRQGILKVFR